MIHPTKVSFYAPHLGEGSYELGMAAAIDGALPDDGASAANASPLPVTMTGAKHLDGPRLVREPQGAESAAASQGMKVLRRNWRRVDSNRAPRDYEPKRRGVQRGNRPLCDAQPIKTPPITMEKILVDRVFRRVVRLALVRVFPPSAPRPPFLSSTTTACIRGLSSRRSARH